jgi:hypothetical protein
MGAMQFNPMDPEFLADPYPMYHRLRTEDPVHHSPLGFWVLTRYEDVVAVLRDGRLAITYGYRSAPFGIRARLSSDEGKTWSDEIPLRTDGGAWDLGYTRTIQRPDGKMLTVYYFNDHPDSERYIGATIWDPTSR